MLAATILRLARTIRCAMVGSATRNAAAISWVVKPATARKVSATCASSAMSKLPMRRNIAPVSRAASSRKTATSAASVAVRVSVRPSSFHSRPDFDRSGAPRLGHVERLVQVLDVDYGKAADDLLRLD